MEREKKKTQAETERMKESEMGMSDLHKTIFIIYRRMI